VKYIGEYAERTFSNLENESATIYRRNLFITIGFLITEPV